MDQSNNSTEKSTAIDMQSEDIYIKKGFLAGREIDLVRERMGMGKGKVEQIKAQKEFMESEKKRLNAMLSSSSDRSICPEVKLTVRSIVVELEKMSSSPSNCGIFRVPEILVKEEPEVYIPRKVSIGPFHHDQKHLQPMEARKMQYFNNFLRRKSPPKLEDYVTAVNDLVERAYQCYPEVHIGRERFVTMMVVDGCFILELLLSEHDTMSNIKWSILVSKDLLLLENQLPFFVLEELYQVFAGDSFSDFICKSFVPRISTMLIGEKDTSKFLGDMKEKTPEDKPKHLLDFVRQFLIPPPQTVANGKNNKEKSVDRATKCSQFASAFVHRLWLGDPPQGRTARMRRATDLKKAGVKFEKNKRPESLLDIKFDYSKGVLTIPGITIDPGAETVLKNLIAYEQFTDDDNYVTEYSAFLDGLVDTGKDVELLEENGIIQIVVGDPSDVAQLFNNLLKDVAVPFNYTQNVCYEVEQYYNIPWHKWKASLMLNYFNTPWSLISVVAAIFLLVLTFTQTYYSAKPYFK